MDVSLGSRRMGRPCRTLLADHDEQRKNHRLSGKPEKPKENFPRLRTYLASAAENPDALSRRDVGMIRKILASFVTKHGEPGSSRLTETRRAQARNAALPGHDELARILATRLIADRGDDGVREIDTRLVPLSKDEARAIDAVEGAQLPPYLIEKAMRCLQAPIETLVERGVVSSSEAIATLLPTPQPTRARPRSRNPTAKSLRRALRGVPAQAFLVARPRASGGIRGTALGRGAQPWIGATRVASTTRWRGRCGSHSSRSPTPSSPTS